MVAKLQVTGLLHNQYKCQVGARRWLWLRCAGALGVGCHIFATISTFHDQVPSMGGQWHSGTVGRQPHGNRAPVPAW